MKRPRHLKLVHSVDTVEEPDEAGGKAERMSDLERLRSEVARGVDIIIDALIASK